MGKIIELRNICKQYKNQTVLDNLSLEVYKGEFLGVSGKSGSGKTTLLNILGFLKTYDKGEYIFDGYTKYKPNTNRTRKLYKHDIGFLFQDYELINHKTVLYNLKVVERNEDMIDIILKKLNIFYLKDKFVFRCSGGEKQRIAIARVYLQKSRVILADEPTGSLDNATKLEIFDLLKELHEEGHTLIVVSHDQELLSICERVVHLK